MLRRWAALGSKYSVAILSDPVASSNSACNGVGHVFDAYLNLGERRAGRCEFSGDSMRDSSPELAIRRRIGPLMARAAPCCGMSPAADRGDVISVIS